MTDLSFVIPMYNEARFIDKCLTSIKQLCVSNQLDADIIVIDNGSTDNSVDLATAHVDHVFCIERTSVSAARNRGAEEVESELIAFIDADVMLTQQWFDCFIANAAQYCQDLNFISGFQVTVRTDGSWIEQHWFSNLNDALLNGGNIITSKRVCELLNGFNASLKTGEDYDFCTRAKQAGVRYIEDPGYVAIHDGFPRDLKNFYRREYWHGEGDFLTLEIFFSSLVAFLGVGYLVMLVLIVISLVSGFYHMATFIAAVLFSVNLAITVKRFAKLPLISLGYNSVLNFIYFFARGMSLFKALGNRDKLY